MTKDYAVLQKKLQELKTELLHVFSLPSQTQSPHLVSDDIKKRFLFVNNLLSTEMSSAYPFKSHHLHHIANELKELESSFHHWEEFGSSGFDNVETNSVCSSCRDGDDSPPETERFSESGFTVYNVPDCFREDETEEKEEIVEGVVGYRKVGVSGSDVPDCFRESVAVDDAIAVEGTEEEESVEEVVGYGNLVKREERKIGVIEYDVPRCFREAAVDEDVEETETETEEESDEEVVVYGGSVRREERKVGVVVKYIGALASGAVIGALMMGAMVNFYDQSQILDYGLIPT